MVPLLLACAEPSGDEPVGADTEPAPTLGEVVDCPAPVPLGWTDRAQERGLSTSPDPDGIHTSAGTTVVEDLDGDGDTDIAINYLGATYVYLREGDSYTLVEAEASADPRFMAGADLDADGQVELIRGGEPPMALKVVDGAIHARALLPEGERDRWTALGVYPGDLECDGGVDLFAIRSNAAEADFLYHGLGDGYFSADDQALPETARLGLGFDARWFDRDGDGDLDVYVVNDLGPEFGPNVFLENKEGTLLDASSACACDLSVSAMGVDAGDVDGDGRPDLYITEAAGAALLYQLPDGAFVDATVTSGIVPPEIFAMGWGAPFADVDNDGDLDIVEARGDLWDDPALTEFIYEDTPELFLQGDDRFTRATSEFGLDRIGSWRAVAPFDANADGVLDLLITDVVGAPLLLESDGCTEASWLEVSAPLYARVEVTAGGETRVGWITRQAGMGAHVPPVAHFGLGDATEVDEVRVFAPGGVVAEIEGPFAARRRVSLGWDE